MDDITICGSNQNDHDDKLNKFMKIAENYNLTINKEKSELSLKEIKILGYNIPNVTVKPDPDSLRALLDMPVPANSASLRRAIGLFSNENLEILTEILTFWT